MTRRVRQVSRYGHRGVVARLSSIPSTMPSNAIGVKGGRSPRLRFFFYYACGLNDDALIPTSYSNPTKVGLEGESGEESKEAAMGRSCVRQECARRTPNWNHGKFTRVPVGRCEGVSIFLGMGSSSRQSRRGGYRAIALATVSPVRMILHTPLVG
jgi:hypothetical protein